MWAVKSALVKRGRFADLQAAGEETRKELEDETMQKALKAVLLNWTPDGGASPATANDTAKPDLLRSR